MSQDIWRKIKAWHLTQHGKDVAAAFELGDFVTNAVILTGLDTKNVVKRIITELGSLAYSSSTYHRACQMVRVFTGNQRRVLIDNSVPLSWAAKLAGSAFDKRRVSMVKAIKTGHLMSLKKSLGETPKTQPSPALHETIDRGSDSLVIQLREHGEFQRSLMLPGFMSLRSQVSDEIILEMINRAGEELRKRGRDIKTYALVCKKQ